MKYPYENLSSEQFEDVIVAICQPLFGISVQKFSTGPDGGRDAKFIGVAELFPSTAAPWKGQVIIQAKHTNGYNKSFSDPDFFSKTGDTTVIAKELPRIKRLKESNNLDHYILFSNRKLSANVESDIREHISKKANIPLVSVYLCGVEQLELFLKKFPNAVTTAGIEPVDTPLIVSPDDLSEVVQALARHRETIKDAFVPPNPRVPYEKKNSLNNMTPEYAKAQRQLYLKDTAQIKSFLSAPENQELLELYESVVEEFQLKIIAKRKDYQTFDDVMNYLIDLLFGRDVDLRRHKRLTRAMLFYMYWICDIGETEDVATD